MMSIITIMMNTKTDGLSVMDRRKCSTTGVTFSRANMYEYIFEMPIIIISIAEDEAARLNMPMRSLSLSVRYTKKPHINA